MKAIVINNSGEEIREHSGDSAVNLLKELTLIFEYGASGWSLGENDERVKYYPGKKDLQAMEEFTIRFNK